MTTNFSIYSIPIYWIISLFPHGYAGAVMKKANNNKWNNVNPRGIETCTSYQRSVPSDVWERFERAEAAHKNSMENAPFFIGAVIVGNMAGLDASTMNKFTGAVLAVRVLYTVLYINTTTRKKSFFRSLSWGACLALVIGLYVKAGNAWAAKLG